MPKQSEQLTLVFQALADPTRRAVVDRLARGARSTTELAEPFEMALPSFMQHLRVLEESALVRSRKEGRVRVWELAPAPLKTAEGWMATRRAVWERRLDSLDRHLQTMKRNTPTD